MLVISLFIFVVFSKTITEFSGRFSISGFALSRKAFVFLWLIDLDCGEKIVA